MLQGIFCKNLVQQSPVEYTITNCKTGSSWFHGSSFKAFLLFILFSDWLKSDHLRSRIERGFLDIFSRHICSAVTETIRVTNYATGFGAKNCSGNQVRSCRDDSSSVEPTIKGHFHLGRKAGW